MSAEILCYITGEEIHAGDRVQYDGNYATVAFVNHGESEESLPGYDDNTGGEPGVILLDDDGGTTNIGYPDDRLAFVDRG